MLAQLRIGMARLNIYPHQFEAVLTDRCEYRQTREIIKYFPFQYRKWMAYQIEMLQYTNTHRGNMSFFLGGKSPSDGQN